jgi:hypothetical protein
MALRRISNKTRAALVVVALAATACGGETPSNTLRDYDGNVTETGGTAGQPVETAAPKAAPTEVLAYAMENSTTQSYSFEQGMAMRMNIGGEALVVAPKTPLVTGFVQGEQSQMTADLSAFVLDTMVSGGIDPLSTEYAEAERLAEQLHFDIWTDGSVVTMDMSSLAAILPQFGESISGTGFLTNGPISIDTAAADGDHMALANSLGMDASTIDPQRLAEALQNLDDVHASGVDTIDSNKVAVYSGRLSMEQWFEVAGQSLDDADSMWGELATGDTESSTAMLRAMTVALEGLDVDVAIMIDGDALMRRLEVSIDMTPLIEVLFTDPDVMLTMAAESGVTVAELRESTRLLTRNLDMSMDVWQNFNEYGEPFVIEIPEATDVTGQYASLLDGLGA